MKNNLKILNITFDTKVKILIIICVLIAIMIIAYSFYFICIDKNHNDNMNTSKKIEEIISAIQYEAEYDITVSGNRTTNCYNVKENVDFENQIYNMIIDDSLNITISSNDTKILKNNMENDYVIINNEILKNNVMSFSSIIECFRGVTNNKLAGNIKRVEQDNKYIYYIITDEPYIEKVKKIEIYTLKDNCKIIEIKMYNSEEKELYSMVFKSFIVKK